MTYPVTRTPQNASAIALTKRSSMSASASSARAEVRCPRESKVHSAGATEVSNRNRLGEPVAITHARTPNRACCRFDCAPG